MSNLSLMLLTIIGGLLTFYSYYYAYNSGRANQLWGGVSSEHKIYFITSSIIAGLVFLYQFYYHVFYKDKSSVLVYIGIFLITYISATWVSLTFYGIDNPKYKFLSMIALLLVSVGSMLLVYDSVSGKVDDDNRRLIAIVTSSIFCFHVTFFDLGLSLIHI